MNFELIALGHPIVDVVVKVSRKEIIERGYEPGSMTLVDYGMYEEKFEDLCTPSTMKRTAGGSAANTAVAFMQCGGSASFLGKVGCDPYGDFFIKNMTEQHVDCCITQTDDGPTGRCLAMIDEHAERTFVTCLGVSNNLQLADIPLGGLSSTGFILVEGYLCSSAQGIMVVKDILSMAQSSSAAIAFSLSNVSVVDHCRDFIFSLFKHPQFSVLFGNYDEFCSLIACGEEGSPRSCSKNPHDVLSALIGHLPLAFMTDGSRGAHVLFGDQIISIPAHSAPYSVVDSNGAGDHFAAGSLYGLLRKSSPFHAASAGACVAARIICEWGARLSSTSARDIMRDVQSILGLGV